MDKQLLGWRNSNAAISYPLKTNTQLENDIIVDACIFLDPPVTLTRIEVMQEHIRFYVNDGIYWQFNIAGVPDYIYNDYGKLVIENISYFLDRPVGYYEDMSIEFIESVCYPNLNLSLMNMDGEIDLEVEHEINGKEITLELPEVTSFVYGGISSVNNQFITNNNLQITGGPCTKVTVREGLVILDDVCLPSCYDCDTRLTTGDVHQLMVELENKVTALEP